MWRPTRLGSMPRAILQRHDPTWPSCSQSMTSIRSLSGSLFFTWVKGEPRAYDSRLWARGRAHPGLQLWKSLVFNETKDKLANPPAKVRVELFYALHRCVVVYREPAWTKKDENESCQSDRWESVNSPAGPRTGKRQNEHWLNIWNVLSISVKTVVVCQRMRRAKLLLIASLPGLLISSLTEHSDPPG